MICCLGVDPGLSGGLVILAYADGRYAVIDKMAMPTSPDKKHINISEIVLFITKNVMNLQFAFIEKVGSMPKQGVASTFKFGYVAGIIEGVLAALCIPYSFVTPQVWQKKVFSGESIPVIDKPSTIWVNRAFPGQSWLATQASRVPHNGMTDAAAISYYGISTRL